LPPRPPCPLCGGLMGVVTEAYEDASGNLYEDARRSTS
jgi:hypothetical protein